LTIYSGGGGRMVGVAPAAQPANLADVLDRVLDKGLVIAGDIRVNLLDVELLTIKLRLLIASVDKAREMGIDWWERDETLTGRPDADTRQRLDDGMRDINDRLDRLERMLQPAAAGTSEAGTSEAGTSEAGTSEPAGSSAGAEAPSTQEPAAPQRPEPTPEPEPPQPEPTERPEHGG
jgi:Gas vesicle protein